MCVYACHRTVNYRKIWNVSLNALMCSLQIINLHWTHIIYPSCYKYKLYLPPLQCWKLLNCPWVGKKKVHLSYIFLHLSANIWLKIQNTHHYRNWLTFLISGQSALNGLLNDQAVLYSKIQNRLSRAPFAAPVDRFFMQYLKKWHCECSPHYYFVTLKCC